MGKTLNEIAQELKDSGKKVNLIYAFNGNGKTRLSREFKHLIEPKENTEEIEDGNIVRKKIIYYNAFTEDLFYWDNDLENDSTPILKIQPNFFTNWIFVDQGQEINISKNFQYYTNEKLTPHLNEQYTKKNEENKDVIVPAFSEVTFSYERGNEEFSENIKISKGEESCFIWSIFYSLLKQVVEVLNIDEDSINQERETDNFNDLKYVFIDDPVTSLDDDHLIQMAVDLAEVIKKSKSDLRFIITTHNPIFYNVLYNEINNKACYMIERLEDNTFAYIKKDGDSNKSFSYHLHLKAVLEDAIANEKIQKFHFTLMRNLYEKTASFLGFPKWSELLPDNKEAYYNRIIQFTSHSTLASEVVAEPTPQEKQTIKILLEYLINTYSFWKGE